MADLHIHSCLSPCGSLRMSPRAIVTTARSRGLDLIAITDHNSCAMCATVAKVAEEYGIAFLYGIELQTREEVHLLAYFDDAAACSALAAEIYPFLPDFPNDPHYFGDQVIVDAEETIIRVEPKLLLNSLTLSLDDVVARVEQHGGLPVPAHVDRKSFSILSQLGFMPSELDFPIVEVVGENVPSVCTGRAVIRASDAHDLDQIGIRTTRFTISEVSIEEIRLAAAGVNGRSIEPISVEGESHERY